MNPVLSQGLIHLCPHKIRIRVPLTVEDTFHTTSGESYPLLIELYTCLYVIWYTWCIRFMHAFKYSLIDHYNDDIYPLTQVITHFDFL